MSVQVDSRTLPRYLLRCLESMSRHDMRDPDNFIQWLIAREAMRRGLLPTDTPAAQPQTEGVGHD